VVTVFCACAALAIVSCLGIGVSAQDAAAPLLTPADLERFEPSIRERFFEAQERALREPTAENIGELCLQLHAYDRFDRAALCYARVRQLAPGAFEWAYYHAIALGMAGDATRAAAALEQALTLNPTDVPARLRLADLWFQDGRIDDSLRLYRELVRDRPASAQAHYGLGRALAERAEPAALAHYERAVALAPDFAAAYYALALAYGRQGDRARADAALERHRALRGVPGPLDDPLLDRLVALRSGPYEDLARGRWLSRQGRYQEAVEALERATRASPALLQAHVNLIAAYAAVGEPEKAEGAYRAAEALNPELPELHYNLGVLRLSQKRDDDAIAAFTHALSSNPAYADAHNNLGFLLSQRDRAREAEEHFRAALAASPGHRDAHFNLARLLLSQRRGEESLVHFSSAVAIEDDKTPLYLYYLADAQARSGLLADAERTATGARERAQSRGQNDLVQRIDEDLRLLRERIKTRR
jgi:tetratricopeptide (TPR) repeat protein